MLQVLCLAQLHDQTFVNVNSFLLKEGGKEGVMIPFHAQILTKFTRHVQF